MNKCLKCLRYTAVLLQAVCFWTTAFSQYIIWNQQITVPVITFEAGARFTYDDNIFLYSHKDLSDFTKSIRAYRYPFETSDDFITTLTGSVKVRPNLFRQKPTIFSLLYRQHIYAVNRMKSYQLFSLSISQNVAKPLTIEIGYLLLPKYLIRYYKDPISQVSPPAYIGCDFTEHLISFEPNYRFKKLFSFTPFYKYEIDDYVAKFDFYDTKAHRLGVNAIYRLKAMFEINGGLEYKIAKAEGPAPDISYNQLGWEVRAVWGRQKATKSFNLRNLKIDISYSQDRREFVTDNSPTVDPFHSGRVDKIQNFKVGLELPFSQVVSMSIGYELEKRDVSSPYKEQIDDIKDYNNNKIGFGLNLRRF